MNAPDSGSDRDPHGRSRGLRTWIWVNEGYRARVPGRLIESIHDIQDGDRYHRKQGRSTNRLRVDTPDGSVSVYLKRHTHWPWLARIKAWLHPGGRHSPAGVEWRNLALARALGIAVPESVAAGEQIGPGAHARSFLMVRELVDQQELHLAIAVHCQQSSPEQHRCWMRGLAVALAEVAARLHHAGYFHKDLYLCHFFVNPRSAQVSTGDLTLIDLHRLRRHRWTAWRWRHKDLAQLLYSTEGVPGIDDRDRLRFWMHYRRRMGLRWERLERVAVLAKARRYRAHNRKR